MTKDQSNVDPKNPAGPPSTNMQGTDTSGRDGFGAKKNQGQLEGYQAANLHSHPLNPANRGDVVTPTPQPDTRPKFAAYSTGKGQSPKQTPNEKSSAE
jgi:hypothetical protein